MKTKVLLCLLTGGLIALAAWFVHVPNQAEAYDIPEKYRVTVHQGLEYLVKNQHKDGHWEGDDGKHPVAMTGLVGLALLMEQDTKYVHGIGEMDPARKYAANILRAAAWLMDKSHAKRDGLIFSEHASERSRYMEGHGLATLFLAGICKDERDEKRRKKLNDVLTRAVKYIVKAQSSQGGWYQTSKVEGHDFDAISATAIQLQALQAAENAGIPVPTESINYGKEYLKMAMRKYDAPKSAQSLSRQADTASSLTCLFNEEGRKKDDLGEKWLKYCQAEIPVGGAMKFGRDELTHYYFAQAVFNAGGKTWSDYRTAMFDHLQTNQNKDGSWPACDGISVGPVYATALWCVVLQLDKGGHPSRRRIPVVVR